MVLHFFKYHITANCKYLIIRGLLQVIHLPNPRRCTGITRHTPVTARGKTDGTYLNAVRHCVSLELLCKEATVEYPHGIKDNLTFFLWKGEHCKLQYLGRGIVISQHVVEEKVVICIGADGILRYLCDFIICLRWQKLRRNRCRTNIIQYISDICFSVFRISCAYVFTRWRTSVLGMDALTPYMDI
mgnify:CR=1 FL=1